MKLFWKIFNLLFIWVLLSLVTNVKLVSIKDTAKASDLNQNLIQSGIQSAIQSESQNGVEVVGQTRLMTKEEMKEFEKVKKPDIPNQISDDLQFMQNELEKSYKEAIKAAYPRFKESDRLMEQFKSLFPEDKREVGVPVMREG